MRKSLFCSLLLFLLAVPARAGVWDSVFAAPKLKQPALLYKTFYRLSKSQDSAAVMQALVTLREEAVKRRVPKLECAAVFYQGVFLLDLTNDIFSPHSLPYFEDALALSRHYQLEELECYFTSTLGYILFRTGKQEKGLSYMLQAWSQAEKEGQTKFPAENLYQQLLFLSLVYATFDNHDRVILYAEQALRFRKKNRPFDETGILLANAWKKKRNRDKAQYYYQESLKSAREANNATQISLLTSGLADLYQDNGEYAVSKRLLTEVYEELNVKNCWSCRSQILAYKIEAELALGNFQTAQKNLRELSILVSQHDVEKEVLLLYYQQTAAILRLDNQFARATLYLDSFHAVQEEIYREKDATVFANLEAQLAAENYLAEKTLLEKENQKQRVIRNASWALSGMAILGLSGLLYSLRRRQRRKQRILELQKKQAELEKEKAELEQQKAQEALEHSRQRLSHYLSSMREKNQLIEKLQDEVAGRPADPEVMAGDNRLLQQLYDSIILTEADWLEFKSVFEKVYPGFIPRLRLDFPDLTVAELRLMLLLKLRLNKKEMAAMLGISAESVRKARQRLRKKLVFDSYKDIADFIEETAPIPLRVVG